MRDGERLLIAKFPHPGDEWDVMAWESTARASADLRQLWRRIAFSIASHKTDDHLRNHGFLRERAGWVLSPAFDLNPEPSLRAQRVTSVGGADTPEDEVRALLAYADSFDLTPAAARAVLSEVVDAVSGWRDAAGRNGIGQREIERFAPTLDSTVAAVSAEASHP
ncbi:HipA domain-containing protein [Herbiconiux liangxiaofengii]|uniref:HipA domain-containing protein n=1 Tax=Herbiconiux liangxiaofengii TaxID=3342795 RepID=UPI0035BA4EF2